MALRGNISAPVQVADLVEVSKDTASLVVCTREKNFWLGGAGFLWVTSEVEDFLATFTWPWASTVRW